MASQMRLPWLFRHFFWMDFWLTVTPATRAIFPKVGMLQRGELLFNPREAVKPAALGSYRTTQMLVGDGACSRVPAGRSGWFCVTADASCCARINETCKAEQTIHCLKEKSFVSLRLIIMAFGIFFWGGAWVGQRGFLVPKHPTRLWIVLVFVIVVMTLSLSWCWSVTSCRVLSASGQLLYQVRWCSNRKTTYHDMSDCGGT